jgi:hypothetical protein
MKILTIETGYDSPGKHDATGAFLPEAAAFRKLHGGSRLEFVTAQTAAKRRAATDSAIRGEPGLDVLATFGHGTATSLIVTGHTNATVAALGAAVREAQSCEFLESDTNLTVILYACSTASGRAGFADHLADLLPGANVWAHTAAGHATWNPNTELAGGPNHGDPIARPGEPLWKRWAARMHDDQAFRLSFWLPAHGLSRADALEAVRGSV